MLCSIRISLLLAAVLSVASVAAPHAAHAEDLYLAQAGGMTLSQAIRSVQNRYGGRIVSATTEVRNGREVHVIRILTDGVVRTIRVAGRSRGNN